MNVSGARQPARDEWQSHTAGCQDRIESTILSEESCEIRRRYEESQRRRAAAGVPDLDVWLTCRQAMWLAKTAGAGKNRDSDGRTRFRKH